MYSPDEKLNIRVMVRRVIYLSVLKSKGVVKQEHNRHLISAELDATFWVLEELEASRGSWMEEVSDEHQRDFKRCLNMRRIVAFEQCDDTDELETVVPDAIVRTATVPERVRPQRDVLRRIEKFPENEFVKIRPGTYVKRGEFTSEMVDKYMEHKAEKDADTPEGKTEEH